MRGSDASRGQCLALAAEVYDGLLGQLDVYRRNAAALAESIRALRARLRRCAALEQEASHRVLTQMRCRAPPLPR